MYSLILGHGEFLRDAKPQRLAWHDFLTNAAHAGSSIPLTLRPGLNEIVLRIDGGKFAGGGFFAAITENS